MDPKLCYSKEEIMSKPHFNFTDNGKNIYMHQKDGNFEIYKKLYLLKPDAQDLTETYVEMHTYLVIKDYLENRQSRWMNEFNAYVFCSIKDYMQKLEESLNNKLF